MCFILAHELFITAAKQIFFLCRRMNGLIGDNTVGKSDSLLVTIILVGAILAMILSITNISPVYTYPVTDTLHLPVLTRVLQTEHLVLATVAVLVPVTPPPRVHTAQVRTLEISPTTPGVSGAWTVGLITAIAAVLVN